MFAGDKTDQIRNTLNTYFSTPIRVNALHSPVPEHIQDDHTTFWTNPSSLF